MRNMRRMGMIITLVRDGADKRSNGEVRWRRGLNTQSGHLSISKVPSIRYRLSPTDKEHLHQGMEAAIAFHFAAGARDVLTMHNRHQTLTSPDQIPQLRRLASGPNQLSMFSAHPTGTARMGKDRQSSVVDETMEMHHHPGIYVMDGSALPTAPGVNPMITILATVSRALELGDLVS
jgi:choline dehydrogenase-like flavoprotein